jgi:hypothetical protein
LGGLAIGALKPTNTWDFYTYLALGCVAVGYTFWRYYSPAEPGRWMSLPIFKDLPLTSQRLLVAAAGILALIGLSILLYLPFDAWYALGYNKIELWKGTHTPLSAYLVHWGVFLFAIISWMTWETRDWLASTPLSSLRKLEPYKLLIQFGVAVLLAAGGNLPGAQSRDCLVCAAAGSLGWGAPAAPGYAGCKTFCAVPGWYRAGADFDG